MRLILPLLLIIQFAHGQITIQDIQYSNNGASPFAGQITTLEGIVTASTETGNLGFAFMQQDSVQNGGNSKREPSDS